MMEISGNSRLRFGPYEVDLYTHELWKHGIKVKLVGQPFEILGVLASRPGELVTREELRAQLWPGDTFVDFDHGLNAAVNKLRDALCDSADDPKYIETLPRRGYRFIAAVEKVASQKPPEKIPEIPPVQRVESQPRQAAVLPMPAPATLPQQAVSMPAPAQATMPPAPKKRRWLVGLAISAVAMFVLLWVFVNIGILDLLRDSHQDARKREAEARGQPSAIPLTSLSDPTSEPAFSPDGTRVAFRRESFLPGASGLYVKTVGGEDLQQVTGDKNDCCPVWSPDGKSIAFSRVVGTERIVFAIPSGGGESRKLFSATAADHEEIDWSPDGKSIAFVARSTSSRTAISLYSFASSSTAAVTMPANGEDDWGPAFSPDGQSLAFVRARGEFESILVMPSGGGELRPWATQLARVSGPPAWSADGQSILFGGETDGRSGLFRAGANGGTPQLIDGVGEMPLHAAVSRRGFFLAYEQRSVGRGIHQLDLYPPGQNPRALVVSSSGNNAGAQISPDGSKLLFGSTRLGSSDLWVSDREGRNPLQLTSIGTAGTPRWSPDGKLIAFDVGQGNWDQPHAIFVVNADGGAPRALVQDNFDNPVPSFSRSSEWVYFASNRSGSWQVWKVAAAGGTPVQVTQQGGFAAWEAPDHTLYYAKHRFEGPEIWKIPAGGGAESPVYPPIRPLDWAAWAVVDQGILFVEGGANNVPVVSFFDFATFSKRRAATLDRAPFWLTATPDGKSIVFDQPEDQYSHILLRANFR